MAKQRVKGALKKAKDKFTPTSEFEKLLKEKKELIKRLKYDSDLSGFEAVENNKEYQVNQSEFQRFVEAMFIFIKNEKNKAGEKEVRFLNEGQLRAVFRLCGYTEPMDDSKELLDKYENNPIDLTKCPKNLTQKHYLEIEQENRVAVLSKQKTIICYENFFEKIKPLFGKKGINAELKKAITTNIQQIYERKAYFELLNRDERIAQQSAYADIESFPHNVFINLVNEAKWVAAIERQKQVLFDALSKKEQEQFSDLIPKIAASDTDILAFEKMIVLHQFKQRLIQACFDGDAAACAIFEDHYSLSQEDRPFMKSLRSDFIDNPQCTVKVFKEKIESTYATALSLKSPAINMSEKIASYDEKLKREKLEKENFEKERLEQERIEKERIEKEKLEKERLEEERLAKQKLEKERLEKEKLEKERVEKEIRGVNETREALNEKNHPFSLSIAGKMLETKNPDTENLNLAIRIEENFRAAFKEKYLQAVYTAFIDEADSLDFETFSVNYFESLSENTIWYKNELTILLAKKVENVEALSDKAQEEFDTDMMTWLGDYKPNNMASSVLDTKINQYTQKINEIGQIETQISQLNKDAQPSETTDKLRKQFGLTIINKDEQRKTQYDFIKINEIQVIENIIKEKQEKILRNQQIIMMQKAVEDARQEAERQERQKKADDEAKQKAQIQVEKNENITQSPSGGEPSDSIAPFIPDQTGSDSASTDREKPVSVENVGTNPRVEKKAESSEEDESSDESEEDVFSQFKTENYTNSYNLFNISPSQTGAVSSVSDDPLVQEQQGSEANGIPEIKDLLSIRAEINQTNKMIRQIISDLIKAEHNKLFKFADPNPYIKYLRLIYTYAIELVTDVKRRINKKGRSEDDRRQDYEQLLVLLKQIKQFLEIEIKPEFDIAVIHAENSKISNESTEIDRHNVGEQSQDELQGRNQAINDNLEGDSDSLFGDGLPGIIDRSEVNNLPQIRDLPEKSGENTERKQETSSAKEEKSPMAQRPQAERLYWLIEATSKFHKTCLPHTIQEFSLLSSADAFESALGIHYTYHVSVDKLIAMRDKLIANNVNINKDDQNNDENNKISQIEKLLSDLNGAYLAYYPTLDEQNNKIADIKKALSKKEITQAQAKEQINQAKKEIKRTQTYRDFVDLSQKASNLIEHSDYVDDGTAYQAYIKASIKAKKDASPGANQAVVEYTSGEEPEISHKDIQLNQRVDPVAGIIAEEYRQRLPHYAAMRDLKEYTRLDELVAEIEARRDARPNRSYEADEKETVKGHQDKQMEIYQRGNMNALREWIQADPIRRQQFRTLYKKFNFGSVQKAHEHFNKTSLNGSVANRVRAGFGALKNSLRIRLHNLPSDSISPGDTQTAYTVLETQEKLNSFAQSIHRVMNKLGKPKHSHGTDSTYERIEALIKTLTAKEYAARFDLAGTADPKIAELRNPYKELLEHIQQTATLIKSSMGRRRKHLDKAGRKEDREHALVLLDQIEKVLKEIHSQVKNNIEPVNTDFEKAFSEELDSGFVIISQDEDSVITQQVVNPAQNVNAQKVDPEAQEKRTYENAYFLMQTCAKFARTCLPLGDKDHRLLSSLINAKKEMHHAYYELVDKLTAISNEDEAGNQLTNLKVAYDCYINARASLKSKLKGLSSEEREKKAEEIKALATAAETAHTAYKASFEKASLFLEALAKEAPLFVEASNQMSELKPDIPVLVERVEPEIVEGALEANGDRLKRQRYDLYNIWTNADSQLAEIEKARRQDCRHDKAYTAEENANIEKLKAIKRNAVSAGNLKSSWFAEKNNGTPESRENLRHLNLDDLRKTEKAWARFNQTSLKVKNTDLKKKAEQKKLFLGTVELAVIGFKESVEVNLNKIRSGVAAVFNVLCTFFEAPFSASPIHTSTQTAREAVKIARDFNFFAMNLDEGIRDANRRDKIDRTFLGLGK